MRHIARPSRSAGAVDVGGLEDRLAHLGQLQRGRSISLCAPAAAPAALAVPALPAACAAGGRLLLLAGGGPARAPSRRRRRRRAVGREHPEVRGGGPRRPEAGRRARIFAGPGRIPGRPSTRRTWARDRPVGRRRGRRAVIAPCRSSPQGPAPRGSGNGLPAERRFGLIRRAVAVAGPTKPAPSAWAPSNLGRVQTVTVALNVYPSHGVRARGQGLGCVGPSPWPGS
jgi:hypothetical protein